MSPGLDVADVVTTYQAVGRELADRAPAIRQLHEAINCGGGLLICRTCGSLQDYVLWPCTTLQILDNMPAP